MSNFIDLDLLSENIKRFIISTSTDSQDNDIEFFRDSNVIIFKCPVLTGDLIAHIMCTGLSNIMMLIDKDTGVVIYSSKHINDIVDVVVCLVMTKNKIEHTQPF